MKKILSLVMMCMMTAATFAADYYTPLKAITNNSASRENCFITDVVPVTETQIAVGFNVRAENGWCAIFSGRNTYAGTGISLYKNGNNTNLGYFTGGTAGAGDGFAPLTCGEDYDVVADVTNLKVTVGGVTTDYPTGNTVTNETTRCLSFFANPEWDNAMRGSIYYFTIYNGEEMIRNYQPVMRQKDGAIGYLDAVGGTFLQPAKVAEQGVSGYSYETIDGNFYFTGFSQEKYTVKVGESVTIVPTYVGEAPGEFSARCSATYASYSGMTITGKAAGTVIVKVSVGSGASKWTRDVELEVIDDSKTTYTEVDYIYFDGANENYKHYFQTGYSPNVNTVVDLNCKGYEKGKGSWRAIFSGRTAFNNGMSLYQNNSGDNTNFGYFVGSNTNDWAGKFNFDTDYTIHFTATELVVNGETSSTKDAQENLNANPTEPITIFSGRNDWPFYGEISYFKISEGGETKHEYVPVMRHDGQACLYDKTTDTYIEPVGDGFYAGLKDDNITAKVVKLEASKKIFKGFTDNLAVELTNGDIADYALTWESSNPAIAEIAEDGTITAKGLGTATITMIAVKEGDFWKLTSTVEVISSVVAVGDNKENWDGTSDIILGSIRKSGDAYKAAHTWTVTSNEGFGDWSTSNPKYNVIIGTPSTDEAGNAWYDAEYEMTNDMTASWVYSATALPNFGPNENPGDVYVRRYFTTAEGAALPGTVYMPAAHDDAPCEYYINGTLVWSRTGYEPGVNGWYEDEIVRLTDEQKALIKTDGSVNVFAYHVHQNWGGRYADGGLYGDAGDVASAFNNNGDRKALEVAVKQAEKVSDFSEEVLAYAKNATVCLQDASLALNKVRYELKNRLAQHNDFYSDVASAEPADGLECWLFNVGTGMFLAGNNDWGTHASVESNMSSWPMVLHANTSGANRYTIQTNLPNGARGANDGLGHNGYVDCGGWNTTDTGWAWEFQAAGDGTYRIINSQNSGDNIYLGVTEDYRYQADTDKAGADNPMNRWKIITRAQLDELIMNASFMHPADATHFIHQANFSQNDFDGNDKGAANADLNDSKWERNAGSIWNWKGNDADGDYVFEAWNTAADVNFKLSQTITGLKPGLYGVSCTGFYRDGDWASAVAGNKRQLASLYTKSTEYEGTVVLPSILDFAGKGAGYGRIEGDVIIPDGCRDAAKFFQYRAYYVEVEAIVGADGTLEIGVVRPADESIKEKDWIVVDNFRLTCLQLTGDNLEVPGNGWATYVAPFNVSELPEGLTVYAPLKQEGYVELQQVDAVPNGEAVVVQGEPGTYIMKRSEVAVELGVTNDLIAAVSPVIADGSQYILASKDDAVGFYKATPETTIPAKKGYLVISADAKAFFPFESEATAIEAIEASNIDLTNAVIYNLAGQRIAAPQQGVNIINGKKYVVK